MKCLAKAWLLFTILVQWTLCVVAADPATHFDPRFFATLLIDKNSHTLEFIIENKSKDSISIRGYDWAIVLPEIVKYYGTIFAGSHGDASDKIKAGEAKRYKISVREDFGDYPDWKFSHVDVLGEKKPANVQSRLIIIQDDRRNRK